MRGEADARANGAVVVDVRVYVGFEVGGDVFGGEEVVELLGFGRLWEGNVGEF